MDQYANSEANLNPLTREFFGFPGNWFLKLLILSKVRAKEENLESLAPSCVCFLCTHNVSKEILKLKLVFFMKEIL